MGRSFWKGSIFNKQLLSTFYKYLVYTQLLRKLQVPPANQWSNVDEQLRLQRRTHTVTPNQVEFINNLLPLAVYNGFDFFTLKNLPDLSEANITNFNLATLIPTREMRVTHKVKLSKAARKNKSKLIKKKTTVLGKSGIKQFSPKKMALTKKIRK